MTKSVLGRDERLLHYPSSEFKIYVIKNKSKVNVTFQVSGKKMFNMFLRLKPAKVQFHRK